jgi:hypothetical protein
MYYAHIFLLLKITMFKSKKKNDNYRLLFEKALAQPKKTEFHEKNKSDIYCYDLASFGL